MGNLSCLSQMEHGLLRIAGLEICLYVEGETRSKAFVRDKKSLMSLSNA